MRYISNALRPTLGIMHVSLPFCFQKNDFFNIGVYIVLSITYGGKGYPFLAEPVFDYKY